MFHEMYNQHRFVPPPPLREKNPAISLDLEQVILKALAKVPQQRFGSVQEFADRLEEALRSPIHQERERDFRRMVVVGLAGLAVVGVAGGGLVWLARSLSPSAPAALTSPTVPPRPASTPTPTPSPTPASTPSPPSPQTIYTQATSGTPTISDPLTGEDDFDWEMFNAAQGGGGSYGYTCTFTGGAYHSSVQAGGNFNHCLAKATNFSNLALQVQMTIIRGPSGGLLFRSNLAQGNFYAFSISTDGAYFLKRISPASIAGKIQITTLTSGSSPAINQGVNQSNMLTVVTQGNTFYLYVNGRYVDSASDSTLTSGAIGVFTLGAEAAFSNLKVWKLP
jgi:hypothetical protein